MQLLHLAAAAAVARAAAVTTTNELKDDATRTAPRQAAAATTSTTTVTDCYCRKSVSITALVYADSGLMGCCEAAVREAGRAGTRQPPWNQALAVLGLDENRDAASGA